MNFTPLKSLDVFQTDMVLGKVSASIGRVQQRLIDLGYLKQPRNNHFDPPTRNAVHRFQVKQGWTGGGADGIPGPSTVARLHLVWHGPAPKPLSPVNAKPIVAPTTPQARFLQNLTREEVIASWKAKYQGKQITSGLCLWYAEDLTKTQHLGYSARDFGENYITKGRRGQIYNVPAGSVIILDNLNSSYAFGHAVASIGGNQVLSTDFPTQGMLRPTTIQAIEEGWGMKMVGWCPRIP